MEENVVEHPTVNRKPAWPAGNEKLLALAAKGKLEKLRALLAAGADVQARDAMGSTALHAAARHGHLEIVALLLAHLASVDAVDRYGMTPLHEAARSGHEKVIAMLLDANAPIDTADQAGWTALHHAAAANQPRALELLMARKADVDCVDRNGHTPLQLAIQVKNLDCSLHLLASICSEAEGGRPSPQRLFERFAASGLPVDARDDQGRTALHWAAHRGDAMWVDALLLGNATQDVLDTDGRTPMHLAVEADHGEVVSALIQHACTDTAFVGCDLDAVDRFGFTALQLALHKDHKDIARQLSRCCDAKQLFLKFPGLARLGMSESLACAIEIGGTELIQFMLRYHKPLAQLGAKQRDSMLMAIAHLPSTGSLLVEAMARDSDAADGRSQAAFLAIEHNMPDALAEIIAQGLPLDALNGAGESLLLHALQTLSERCAVLLMAHGATLTQQEEKKQGILHRCAAQDLPLAVAEALKCSISVDCIDAKGATPLMLCADRETCEVLLKAGANVHHRAREGNQPIHSAAERQAGEVVQALLQFDADINALNELGQTPLCAALWDQGSALQRGGVALLIVTRLLNKTYRMRETGRSCDEDPVLPALQEEYESRVGVAALLLQLGARWDLAANDGTTALHVASKQMHPDVIETLLAAGAPIGGVDHQGWTPLHHAVTRTEGSEVIELLLKHRADAMARSDNGIQPIHVAAKFGKPDHIRRLLQAGADVNSCDDQQWTPLFHAASAGKQEAVDALCEIGARTDMLDRDGKRAFAYWPKPAPSCNIA